MTIGGDFSSFVDKIGEKTAIKKIEFPPFYRIYEYSKNNIVEYINEKQENENNFDENGQYKFLYFTEILDIYSNKTFFILSQPVAFIATGNPTEQVLEIQSANEALIEQKAREIYQNLFINNDEFLQEIAIRVIEHMNLNGVDFTYSPTIAKVALIKDDGTVINLPFDKTENGIYEATASLSGEYKIQISARTDL